MQYNDGYDLIKPTSPLRLATSTGGIFLDGWTGPTSFIDVFNASPSSMHIKLDRKGLSFVTPESRVRIRTGPLEQQADGSVKIASTTAQWSGSITNSAAADATVKTPAGPFRVEITIDPAFPAALSGNGDPRQLGARIHASFNRETVAP